MKYLILFIGAVLLLVSTPVKANSYWLNARLTLSESAPLLLKDSEFGAHKELIQISDTDYLLRGEFDSLNLAEAAIAALSNQEKVVKVSSYFSKENKAWSFQAKTHRLTPQARTFLKLQRLYINAGSLSQIAPIMARYKKAFTDHKIERDIRVFTSVTGPDAPFIEVTRYAKSKQDDQAYEDSVNQALGKPLLIELSKSFGQHIRKGDAAVEGKVVF